MKIIYGCSACSRELFSELLRKYHIKSGHAVQKYHGLMLRGLAENGAEVRCVCALPVTRSVTSEKLIRAKDERADNVLFHYITTLNRPVFRQLMIFFGTLWFVLRTKKEKDTCAVVDCLNIACAYGMLLGCKLRRIKATVIVTDLPDMEHSGILRRVNNGVFNIADAFVLLTEQMNAAINAKNRPYIVLEGHVDSEAPLPEEQTACEEEGQKKVVLYAGSVNAIYGIESLAEGFLKAAVPGAELRVFGNGDFVPRLRELCGANDTVKYMGVAPNEEIVRQEQKAELLVNPRPAAPAYTKYSFPSKNMEYMVSGTPLLTTDLPGMPREYLPYVYLLRDESTDGIAGALRHILSLPREERVKKGQAARAFVLRYKSNVTQAGKLLDFLQEMS